MAMPAEAPRKRENLIRTLAKHAQHIQRLQCACKTSEMLTLLETLCLFLPSLKTLYAALPLEVLEKDAVSGFEWPLSLEELALHVPQERFRHFDFATLKKHSKILTKLAIGPVSNGQLPPNLDAYNHRVGEGPPIGFCNVFPKLQKISLTGAHTFYGSLAACNLREVSIASVDSIYWTHFDQCRQLQSLRLLTKGSIDFTGSSQLSFASMQIMSLEGRSVQEDGAFKGLQPGLQAC